VTCFCVAWDVKLCSLIGSRCFDVCMRKGKKFRTVCMRRLLRQGLKLLMPWHDLPRDLVPTQVIAVHSNDLYIGFLLIANHCYQPLEKLHYILIAMTRMW